MPLKIIPEQRIFLDAPDEFFVDANGVLYRRTVEGEADGLVRPQHLEDFRDWLTSEIDRRKPQAVEAQPEVKL